MDNELRVKVTADDTGFAAAMSRTQESVRRTARQVEESGMSMEKTFDRIKRAATISVAGIGIQGLISDIIRVRGEFQKADTAIQTMLGSKEKADELLSKVREYAKISPLEFGDITRVTQMMLGFNIEAEKVPKFIKAIGDVSMGEGSKFNSLALAFSQMSAAGKLMGQDLNQMINAGFNPLSVMAEKTGKSIAELKEQMSKGAITAEMVQQAFIDATSEGGKFFNMSENAAKTIEGQISMLHDAMDAMFNELGTKGESVIVDSISAATNLIENYKEVGSVIADLVIAYGSYKAALLILTGIEKVHVYWQGLEKEAAMMNTLANAGETGSVNALTIAKLRLTSATKKLTATMMANPYVAIGAAIAAFTVAIYKATTATDAFDEAQERLQEKSKENEAGVLKEVNRLEELNRKLQECEKGSDQYKKVKQSIIDQYGQYYKGLDDEIEKVGNLSGVYDKLTEAIRRSIGARNLKSFYDQEMDNYDKMVSGKLDKAYKALKEKYGDSEGSRLYHNLYSETILGKKGSLSSEDIGKLRNTTFFDVRWGKNAKDGLVDVRASIDDLREDIYDTKAASDKVLKEYKDMYEITDEEWNEALNPSSTTTPTKPTTPTTPKKGGKGGDNLDKEAALRQKRFELNMRQAEEMARQERETLASINKAKIAAIDDDAEREREEQAEQHRLALQAIDIREEEMKKRLYEYNKSVWEANNKDSNKKYSDTPEGAAGWQAIKLSEAQVRQLQAERDAEDAVYARSIENRIKNEERANNEAINTYLKQYGDYNQKLQAIYAEANDKICEYEEQLANAQDDIARQAAQARIDTVKAETQQQIEELDLQYGKAKAFMIDLFEDASEKSVAEIDKIIKKYEALAKFLGGDGTVTREQLIDLGFSDSEIDKAIEKLNRGEITVKEFTDKIKELNGELEQRSSWISFTNNITKALDKIKNSKGDVSKIGSGIEGIGNAVSDFAPSLKQFSSDLANIFDFDDTKVQSAIDGLEGLGSTAAGVGQIMSGDIVGGVMNTVNGVSKIVTAFDGLFGADYSQYNRMVDEYNKLIDVWDDLIDRKSKYIEMSYGTEAERVGKEAIDIVNRQIEAYQKLGKERLNAGASAGSHSIGVRMSKEMDAQDWENIAKALGTTVDRAKSQLGGRLTGLFDMTTDQLKKLQEEAPEFWAKMDEDVQKYLQGIIDGTEKIEDLQRQLQEQLTSTTFDNLKSNFANTLYDMKSTAEDGGKGISEALFRSIVDNFILGSEFDTWLSEFYKKWADKIGSGTMTKRDWDEYNDEYQREMAKKIAERDAWASAIGYTDKSVYEQKASSGGWQSMGQDTADELNGRFTALQMSGERISEGVINMLATLETLASFGSDNGRTLAEIRNLMVTNNAYLEDILGVNKKMRDEFNTKLDKISTNTK